MPLENYVKLQPEVEKVILCKAGTFHIEEVTIPDPKTRQPKRVRRAVVEVTEEDYRPTTKIYSTLASKHADDLEALHKSGDLYTRRTGITWHPADLAGIYTIRQF